MNIYYVRNRKDFGISLALYRDTTIMIILAKFEINLKIQKLQDIRRIDLAKIIKIFHQLVIRYISKPALAY